jgi:hypothetical protein
MAVCFGLTELSPESPIAAFLMAHDLDVHPYLRPYVIEAMFRLGRTEDALALAGTYSSTDRSIDTNFLVRRYALGLAPREPGWTQVTIAPGLPPNHAKALSDDIELPHRRVTAHYIPNVQLAVTVAPGTLTATQCSTGLPIMVKNAESHLREPLTQEQFAVLADAGWAERTGGRRSIWIDVDEQMLRVIEGGNVLYQARCATASNGVGSEMNSMKTPLGWHSVARRIGENAPWGRVFRARAATNEIWQPGDDVTEDLVLTRVILLAGEEPGVNKGGNVDSMARHIYIHGTNDEARIGTPSSHGCIRMLNDDIVEMFPMIPDGAPVLITATVAADTTD